MFRSKKAFGLVVAGALAAQCSAPPPKPIASVLVPGQSNKGDVVRRINGLDFNRVDGKIYATSTTAEVIYRVDPKTGDVDIAVPAPFGEGDDVAAGPDGALAWTAIATGEFRYKKPGGEVQVLDKAVPGINPVAFSKDGRLVAAQANEGHALYEYDPSGVKPRRTIMQDMPDLNSFAFGANGLLYAPQRGGKAVEIDIDKGTLRVISEDNGGAVKVADDGQLIAISKAGDLVRMDPQTGAATVITKITGGVDGLSVGPDGTIYGSSPSESSIFAIDPTTGARRDIVRGRFSSPAGLAMIEQDGAEILLVGDPWGFRNVNPTTGEVTRVPTRGLRAGGSSDIAVASDAIALSNVRLGVVQKLERGTEKVQFETKEIKTPYGVALLDDGAVAVADIVGKRIARVDATGVTTLAGDFLGPVGLARDGATLLVADALAGTISRIDLKSGQKTEIAAGLKGPEGLAVMKDGRIAVAETGAGRLIALDAKSKAQQALADGLPFGAHITATADGVGLPAGVTVGKDGSVYVTCDGDFSIRKVTFGK